ncbi:GNAT family N-acetyltransferase [Paractinoplanes ferrugineus]|uniref:N-acetyltransferase n=1 Tax=Paractinoplanes ferrugineus TaxID=113564 RepID=A0A919MH46_9ACTN|nr:GNAT family N-acetyltransferase [Actinoplanes ferrugineus]GIE12270.1 N-acetyltransferase [Actinoplanes ferrugineus]
MSEIEVHDNPELNRFELLVDGAMAGLAAYRRRDDAIVVTHSEVDREFRGQGLGNELAQRTLDLIRSRGEKVVPVCPFFAKYVAEHPDYDDIVVS